MAALVAFVGLLVTFLLPEPDTKSLEAIEQEGEHLDEKLDEEGEKKASPTRFTTRS